MIDSEHFALFESCAEGAAGVTTERSKLYFV